MSNYECFFKSVNWNVIPMIVRAMLGIKNYLQSLAEKPDFLEFSY